MTSTVALVIAVISHNPINEMPVDSVDLIEINHFYDNGNHVLDQAIFYDWCPREKRYHVRDWRPLKRVAQLPHRDWDEGGYIARWYDAGVVREVRAKVYRETWTQYDPEFVERHYLPKSERQLLAKRLDPQRAEELARKLSGPVTRVVRGTSPTSR